MGVNSMKAEAAIILHMTLSAIQYPGGPLKIQGADMVAADRKLIKPMVSFWHQPMRPIGRFEVRSASRPI